MCEIEKLKKAIQGCTKCKVLIESRRQIVFGYGVLNPEVLIVGEAPSKKGSDIAGMPFTNDRSGFLLRKVFKKYDFSDKTNLYITNLIKCCPPNNRTPTPIEILNCSDYLEKEISIINPKIIVPLGSTATTYFLKKRILIKGYHRQLITIDKFVLFPMFHPGYVVRGNLTTDEYEEGFRQLQKILHKCRSG